MNPAPQPSPPAPSSTPAYPARPTPGLIPPASPPAGPAAGNEADGGGGGWFGDLLDIPKVLSDAAASFLGMLIDQAKKPVFALLGDTLLSTPNVTANPALTDLWAASLGTAGAVYVLFVLVGGVLVMGYETVQTRYALKQIAPRLVIGLVAAASSLTVLSKAIMLANAASWAILGNASVSGKSIAQQLVGQMFMPANSALYGLILGLILLALVFGVLLGYTVRIALIAVLAASAPLALACHALPMTDGIARLWWRAITGCLVIQLAQSTVFVVGLRLFFTKDNTLLGLPNPTQLSNLLAGMCLFWVLVKIPGWTARVIFRATPITLPGTPMPLRILRSVALAYVMRGAFRGGATTRTPPARPGPGRGPRPGPGGRPSPRPGPGPGHGPAPRSPSGRRPPGARSPGSGTPPIPAGPATPNPLGRTTPSSGGSTVPSPSPPGGSGSSTSSGVPHPVAARRAQQLTLPISASRTPGRPGRAVQTWLPINAPRRQAAARTPPSPAQTRRTSPGSRGRQTVLPIRVARVRLRPPRPVQLRLPLEGPSTPPHGR